MRRALVALLPAVALALSACTATAAGSGAPAGADLRAASDTSPASPPPGDRYAVAVDALAVAGVRVWIESDLLRRWLQGRASFDAAIRRVADLAARPGVDGVKVADELGYHDGTVSPAQVQAFLHDTATAVRRAAPGRLVLVDMVVPELGCLPWRAGTIPGAGACAAAQAARYPAASRTAVDGYLRSGDVDVLDLSIGLRPDATYAAWHVPRDTAVSEAWQEARRRGWASGVRLQARKALAHPGSYAGGVAGAERDLRTFVDTPLSSGAAAVDVWTWRQPYQGQVVRLLDPGLRDNDLWRGLLARRHPQTRPGRGAPLWTHLSPSSLELGLPRDVARLRTVFSAVFVAAGTG